MAGTVNGGHGDRAVWVEPEVRYLDVTETALFPRVGRDGGNYPDCTRS